MREPNYITEIMKILATLEHPIGYGRNIIEVEFYLISLYISRRANSVKEFAQLVSCLERSDQMFYPASNLTFQYGDCLLITVFPATTPVVKMIQEGNYLLQEAGCMKRDHCMLIFIRNKSSVLQTGRCMYPLEHILLDCCCNCSSGLETAPSDFTHKRHSVALSGDLTVARFHLPHCATVIAAVTSRALKG
ncbi:hypothetical protein KCU66_g15, partial [Aureobasidium melanogenum]